MITHEEPDILECKVKWALGSITTNKASGGDGILVEVFQILKDDADNMSANLENSAVATGRKRSVFIPIPKKGNAKECSNYRTVALISHTSKVILKVLNYELLDIQDGFRKGRGTRDEIANIHWIIKKARVSEKHLLLLF